MNWVERRSREIEGVKSAMPRAFHHLREHVVACLSSHRRLFSASRNYQSFSIKDSPQGDRFVVSVDGMMAADETRKAVFILNLDEVAVQVQRQIGLNADSKSFAFGVNPSGLPILLDGTREISIDGIAESTLSELMFPVQIDYGG